MRQGQLVNQIPKSVLCVARGDYLGRVWLVTVLQALESLALLDLSALKLRMPPHSYAAHPGSEGRLASITMNAFQRGNNSLLCERISLFGVPAEAAT
jgi:hypothetical protein